VEYLAIEKDELVGLLSAANKLYALNCGGVDNWSWYWDSLDDYLRSWAAEHDFDPDEDWGFVDIAAEDIKRYPTVEKFIRHKEE
jgi:hypothetical protein